MGDQGKLQEHLIREVASLQDSLRRCSTALQACSQDLDDVAHYVVSEFKGPLGTIVGFAELLEEECTTLSDEEIRRGLRVIRESGRKLNEMVNVLLLLANSHRLFDNVWHAAYLATMGETALPQWACEEGIPEAYRFTCLPVSSVPLVMRVWRAGDGVPDFHAVAKFRGGSQDHGPESEVSSPLRETRWSLTAEQWAGLLSAIEESQFWTEPPVLEPLGWSRMVGTGGEEWIFEGWRDGQSKVRAVLNPDEEKEPAAYGLGRSFINILPGWFALEVTRFWAANSWVRVDQRFEEEVGLLR